MTVELKSLEGNSLDRVEIPATDGGEPREPVP
jgi:hypothetical protein